MLYKLLTKTIDRINEATVADITRKQRTITSLFPAHPGRVEKVGHMGGVRLDRLGTESWHFKIHSGTKKSVWYDAVIKFSNITPTLEKLVKDRRLWTRDKSKIDLRLLANEFRNQAEVKITCNCPCQQYWGFNYILSKDKYNAKYGDKETRAPRIRNPHQYGAVCKHLDALFKALPFYNSTIARWLNDFYGKDIEEFEDEAKKESEEFKKAGEELGKRKEIKKEEPEKEEPEKEETKESINERGYVGYSKSKRAVEAEHIGKFPASIAAKKLGVTTKALKQVLSPSEWHHTSCKYNPTDYYDINVYINPQDYDEDTRMQADEDLKQMKELSRKKVVGYPKEYENVKVKWAEWSGSRSHPKMDIVELDNVKIIDKGGEMVEVHVPAGIMYKNSPAIIFRKKKSSKWFDARDKNGYSIFSGGYALRESINEDKFAKFVYDEYENDKRTITGYTNGTIKSIAEASNDKYTVKILDNNKVIYILNRKPNKPVPAGDWMGWWEPDYEKYFKVDKFAYGKLSRNEKAQLEAELQLKLWVDIEFWGHYADFYLFDEYTKWWFEEGGSKFTSENGIKAENEYWKNRLKESVDYSGVKALYKVYHDIERGIDPSPENVFEALYMMKGYYKGYLEWYDKYEQDKIEDEEIYKAYRKRLQEIQSAIIRKDPGEALVALDNAVNQWHRDFPALGHLVMDIDDPESRRGLQLDKWLEEVRQILTKLGRLPEESPY